MNTYDVEYQYEGRRMVGYFAVPDGEGPRAAVLVCHEGPGLDDHAKSRAQRLADLGYLAFALDYHGDGRPLSGGLPEVRERLGPLMANPLLTRSIGQAGLDILLSHERCDASRVGAIGYCFGGTMAIELARGGAPLQAVVGFHSGLGTARPDDAAGCTAKVMACIGAADPMVNADQRTAFELEMTNAGVDWTLHVYGGAVHSFTNVNADLMGMPQAVAYHEPTDRRSWQAMLNLFAETID
jgi:dienelactone hydrolase